MKYIAQKDLPPNVKAGDEVEIEGKLIPEFEEYFKAATSTEEEVEEDDGNRQITGNPSREDLKARATALDIVFAPNIPTAKLIELIEEAEAAKSLGGQESEDPDGSEGKSEGEE